MMPEVHGSENGGSHLQYKPIQQYQQHNEQNKITKKAEARHVQVKYQCQPLSKIQACEKWRFLVACSPCSSWFIKSTANTGFMINATISEAVKVNMSMVGR